MPMTGDRVAAAAGKTGCTWNGYEWSHVWHTDPDGVRYCPWCTVEGPADQ